MPILSLQNVVAGYGDVIIVKDVSLGIEQGNIAALVGPNGSGKSTLLKSLLGFAHLFSGKVLFKETDVTGLAPNRLVTMGIGYVPQVNNVFPNLTIAENLDMGAYSLKGREKIKSGMADMYAMFPELEKRKGTLAGNLSGGERQMIAIARAMIARPSVLLLDEPLASLSPKPATVILSKLKIIKEAGTAILMVEQNVRKALSIADQGYVLVDGCCAMQGDASSLLSEDASKQKYLGLEDHKVY
jgi:ABC-type branched-subunit amino acid transport system ATPase component